MVREDGGLGKEGATGWRIRCLRIAVYLSIASRPHGSIGDPQESLTPGTRVQDNHLMGVDMVSWGWVQGSKGKQAILAIGLFFLRLSDKCSRCGYRAGTGFFIAK